MSEVESWNGDGPPGPTPPIAPTANTTPATTSAATIPPPGSLVRQPPGGGIDRNRAAGLDLTPEERRARRVNRRWLLGLAVPSVLVLALALLASGIAQHNEPRGPNIAVPSGYQAVRDGYFTYAVPRSWPNNAEYSDNTGDIVNSGPDGWAGQHVGFRTTSPVLGETPPASLQAFGLPRPAPFDLTGGHAVAVPGAAAAFAYLATRPGGFRATVIDAYYAPAAVEIWLMVDAPAGVTDRIVSSLRG